MGCINAAKYTMTATLLHVDNDYVDPDTPTDVGQWVESQDPITGEIVSVWQPGGVAPTSPDVQTTVGDFNCVARGMSTSNRYGSTENFGKDYENVDLVRLWIPPTINIKKSDRVYNIRSAGTTLWSDDDGKPLTFNVNGITPQFGPFNVHTETFVLLERVEAGF